MTTINTITSNGEILYIPKQLWFTKNVNLSIPCCSLPFICITCGETYKRNNQKCYYCTDRLSTRAYMRLRRLRRHRRKYELIMRDIKRFDFVFLLKNKYNKVMDELLHAPPMTSTLSGGLIYQNAKESYETNIAKKKIKLILQRKN